MEPEDLAAFRQGSELAVRVMSDAAVSARWNDAGALPGFTVGGIAAHLYAATRRFEVALDEPLSERPTADRDPGAPTGSRRLEPGEWVQE